MIKETQVKEILESNIPEMQIETAQLKSLYKTIDRFAAFTKEMMREGNLPLIRDCFTTAEYLLDGGTTNIKLAIENIYVFTITGFMDITGAVSKQVKELMPAHLKESYQKQVCYRCP